LALPWLVDFLSELRDRKRPSSVDEGAAISDLFKVSEYITDAALSEMTALAFENQERPVSPQDSICALENADLSPLNIDLQNRYALIFGKVAIERHDGDDGRSNVCGRQSLAVQRCAGRVAFRDEELSLSRLRENGLWLNCHVVQTEGSAHSGQVVGEILLRLESHDAALLAPMSKPKKKAALVRSNVADEAV
jgi:hypothetical protein